MRWLKSRAWARVLGSAVLVLLVVGAVARFTYITSAHGLDYLFTVLGDVARNTGGLFAVGAASVAAWIAFRTNQARAEEAARAHFKDRLQWAVEHSRTSNDLGGVLAEHFIESTQDSSRYSSEDIEIARAVSRRQVALREQLENHAAEYKKIVSENLELLWHEYKDVILPAEAEAEVQILQREFRELRFGLSQYNKDVQYMLMADRIQRTVEVYRRIAESGDQQNDR
ncbi:MAG: hypothetical protein SOR40_01800 [Rothia sp. (in: high G+C Gram-positive bacteria)]|nr:hypothetical protein [Rothia sp. (in: high G+C Gram-positive bacteria)]